MSSREHVERDELLVSLREKHGHDFVSMKDLENPSSDFMMRYFATVIAGIGVDIKGMTNQEYLQALPYADSFKDIHAYTQVYTAVKMVCPIPSYFKKFSLRCLMEPKPEDIHYVAVMDNFYDFYFQRTQDLVNPRLEAKEELRRRVQELKQRKAQLQHLLNDRAAARSKRAVEQAQAERQNHVLLEELKEVKQQEEQLAAEDSELNKTCQVLVQELERNRLHKEQLEEQKVAQVELVTVKEELEQLRDRRTEQETELDEKRHILLEKSSFKRFMETCKMQETQATQALTELVVEMAASLENQKKKLHEDEVKTGLLLKKLEAVEKSQGTLEKETIAKKEEIAEASKNFTLQKKEMKVLDRTIQEVYDTEATKEQSNISLVSKIQGAEAKICEKKEELLKLDEMFKIQSNKLYEVRASMKEKYKDTYRQYVLEE